MQFKGLKVERMRGRGQFHNGVPAAGESVPPTPNISCHVPVSLCLKMCPSNRLKRAKKERKPCVTKNWKRCQPFVWCTFALGVEDSAQLWNGKQWGVTHWVELLAGPELLSSAGKPQNRSKMQLSTWQFYSIQQLVAKFLPSIVIVDALRLGFPKVRGGVSKLWKR